MLRYLVRERGITEGLKAVLVEAQTPQGEGVDGLPACPSIRDGGHPRVPPWLRGVAE